jgi:hypothetical protein
MSENIKSSIEPPILFFGVAGIVVACMEEQNSFPYNKSGLLEFLMVTG